MPSILRLSAATALVSTAAASGIGAIASQTIAGFGAPLFAEPTKAPEYELVKAKLAKKAVTNVCSEWTIPGGFGQPECANSETCLFTSAGDYWYEGCGQTSIAYNWITACYNYPKASTQSPPVSNTYCPKSEPYCGYYAFIFDVDYTAWNFGCSTAPYSFLVDLIPTTSGDSTTTDVLLNGGGGSSIAVSVGSTTRILSQSSATGVSSTPTEFVAPSASATSGSASASRFSTRTASGSSSGSSSSTSPIPDIGSHNKSSTPIGAIVGGVVGGVAVIALAAFLIWFCLRRRRQDRARASNPPPVAQVQPNQAAPANGSAYYNNNNRISEIGGTMKPPAPPGNTYVPPPAVAGVYGEKPAAAANTQEFYRPGQDQNLQPHSPPPVYAQPGHPPNQYNELEQQNANIARPISVPPVSPQPTGTSQGVSPVGTPSPQQQYQHMSMISNASELSGNHMQQQAQAQQHYSPRPGFQEMSSNTAIPMTAAVPMRPAGSPPGVAEMHAHPQQQQHAVQMRPAGAPPGSHIQEMSGAATGGVNRPAGPPPGHAQAQAPRFDMNGNPMSEYHGAELE